jgi:hypothetical protein
MDGGRLITNFVKVNIRCLSSTSRQEGTGRGLSLLSAPRGRVQLAVMRRALRDQ